jgi:hypothetical protein
MQTTAFALPWHRFRACEEHYRTSRYSFVHVPEGKLQASSRIPRPHKHIAGAIDEPVTGTRYVLAAAFHQPRHEGHISKNGISFLKIVAPCLIKCLLS